MCGVQGHSKGKCPNREQAAPATPDPDTLVEPGEPIGIIDIEHSTEGKGSGANVHEAAAVVATYTVEGKWEETDAEFHMVVKGKVMGWAKANCPGLAKEASQSKKTYTDMFMGLVDFVMRNKIKWLKAHNGVPSDFLVLYEQARREKIPDPLRQLEEAGVKGFIDPGRIIPLHKITDLQREKSVKGGGKSG